MEIEHNPGSPVRFAMIVCWIRPELQCAQPAPLVF